MVFRDLVPEIPSTTYATFGLYKYPAKFIPQVIAYALKTYASPGTSVLDPFAGYGTVGAVARIYGHDYELWDLNPLLERLHAVAVAPPPVVDAAALVDEMRAYRSPFVPDWPNAAYWYPEAFMPMLSEAWGFFHSLEDEYLRRALLIPLMKTTRYFSYNDERRQKLSRSNIARERTEKLEREDWRDAFYRRVQAGVEHVLAAQKEYAKLGPKPVRSTVRAGVDGLATTPETGHGVLITSPPYLQAQEYIRASKMDLFWLGHSAAEVRELGKREFPYQDVPEIPVHSETYFECLRDIREPAHGEAVQAVLLRCPGHAHESSGAHIGAVASVRGAGDHPDAAHPHRPHIRRALPGPGLAARGHARRHHRHEEPVFVPGEPGHRRA